jgi:hypothetical protein
MKDLLIIPDTNGRVEFEVRGRSEDTGLLLIQRLYVLLFTGPTEAFRDSGGGLSGFLEGANIPDVDSFNALLAVSVSGALNALEPEDRARVDSFTAKFDGESISCTLKLTDGTTVNGILNND